MNNNIYLITENNQLKPCVINAAAASKTKKNTSNINNTHAHILNRQTQIDFQIECLKSKQKEK